MKKNKTCLWLLSRKLKSLLATNSSIKEIVGVRKASGHSEEKLAWKKMSKNNHIVVLLLQTVDKLNRVISVTLECYYNHRKPI